MNCFVISLGGDGQLQWLRQMGEPFPSVEIPSALAVDSNGSVFVAGTRKLATESGLRSVGRFLYAHGSNGDTLADWVQADLPFGASAVPLDIEVVETGKVLVGGYFNYRNPMRILSSGAYQEDPIVEVFQLSRDTSVETEWVIQRSDIEVRPMTEGTNDIRVVDIEMMGTGEVLMACTLGVKQSKDSQIPLRNDSVVVFWDPDAIDEAVDEIAKILQRTVFRGMRQIGEYVLKQFYDNDVSLVRSRSHGKHATLRALIKRCKDRGLPVSRTFLNNSINVAILVGELELAGSSQDYKSLSKSHQVELLSVGRADIEVAALLAARARQEGWSVVELRGAVKAEREGTSRATSSNVATKLKAFTTGIAGKNRRGRIAWKRLAEDVPATKLDDAIKMATKAQEYADKLLEALEERQRRETKV